MDTRSTLVQSSLVTKSWLQRLRDRLPDLQYSESGYYAAFRTERSRRVVAYLNPAKRSIRLFLSLKPGIGTRLQPTLSTSGWASRFPSVFPIAGEKDVPMAAGFITQSRAATTPSPRERTTRRPEYTAPEELPSASAEYVEGAARSILVNAYERNRRARERCIQHYGRTCAVCDFDFGARYGQPAMGYIQIHHVVPIARVRKQYRLNPINDLRPVCPNCHAVIHRREPPFSIDEVKQMLRDPP
jgi:5-methylcytosine-specific restriction endonuclease McrA